MDLIDGSRCSSFFLVSRSVPNVGDFRFAIPLFHSFQPNRMHQAILLQLTFAKPCCPPKKWSYDTITALHNPLTRPATWHWGGGLPLTSHDMIPLLDSHRTCKAWRPLKKQSFHYGPPKKSFLVKGSSNWMVIPNLYGWKWCFHSQWPKTGRSRFEPFFSKHPIIFKHFSVDMRKTLASPHFFSHQNGLELGSLRPSDELVGKDLPSVSLWSSSSPQSMSWLGLKWWMSYKKS